MRPGLRVNLLAGASPLGAGCAMMEPKAERYVAPPPGSTWKHAAGPGSRDAELVSHTISR